LCIFTGTQENCLEVVGLLFCAYNVGKKLSLRVLKDTAVPHIFAWSAGETVASQNRTRAAEHRERRASFLRQQADDACMDVAVEEIVSDRPTSFASMCSDFG